MVVYGSSNIIINNNYNNNFNIKKGTKLLNRYNEYTGHLKSLFKHVLKKKLFGNNFNTNSPLFVAYAYINRSHHPPPRFWTMDLEGTNQIEHFVLFNNLAPGDP